MRFFNTHAKSKARKPLLKRYLKDSGGAAAIEAALVFPVMAMLFTGLIDLTDMISASRKVTLATNTIADLATQANGKVTKSDLDGYFKATKPILDPFPNSKIGLALYTFRRNGSRVRKVWEYKKGSVNCGAAPVVTAKMKTLMTDGNDLIVARGCYAFKPIIGYVIGTDTAILQEEVMLRPRQSTQLVCDDCSS